MDDSSQKLLQEHRQQQRVEQEETTSLRDKLCISTRCTTLPANIVTGVTMWSSQASTKTSQVHLKHL